ncbi:MAG TPA: hypothetical protein VHH11_15695 [Gammaproteobacteria bacterium]|jgi:hypothetical protein|nr:hypothetical protein [Gammaproteobacteria bacterium]
MSTDDATIQVRIRELRQLFNTIDPSPFGERDLDPDCEEFIVAWARELPPDRPVNIAIHVERERPAPELLAGVADAVRSHFAREAGMQDLRRRRILREARLALAIGLAALILCVSAATLVPTRGTLGQILRESLVIAGWVVMWHPLEVLLYGIWPVVRERRLLARLAAADVELTTPPPATA